MKKLLMVSGIMCLLALGASAQTTYLWTNIVSGYVSNSWATAANWLPAGPASGTGNTAQFTLPLTNTAANNGVIALSSSPTIGNLIFGNTSPSNISWTVNTGSVANATLTLNTSSGTPSVSVTNRGVTFNAGVGGTQGFNLSGGGTMQLNAAGSFTGGAGAVAVQAGTLLLGSSSALTGLNTVTVSNTAQLALNTTATYPVLTNTVLLGNGSAGVGSQRGALYVNGNNLTVTWPGPIAVTNGTIGNYGASGTITLPNVISGTNLAFFAGGGSTTHVLTVNLNTNETYTGSTTFNATYGSSSLINLNGGVNTLPTGTTVTINDTAGTGYYVNMDLHGNNQTVSSLTAVSSAGGIVNIISSSGKPTLTMTSTGAGALAFGGATNTINGVNVTVGSGSDNSTDFGGAGATATTVNITNATINSSYYTDVGRAATTSVNLNNGTVFNNTGEILIGYGNAAGIGTLNVNTGAVVSAHYIRVGQTANATLNLNAGSIVSVDEVYTATNGITDNVSNLVNLSGALIQPHTAPLTPWFASSLTNVQVQTGGAVFNTVGQNLTVASSLLAGSPSGGLTLLGTGTLTLSGTNNNYTGSTVISNGTLAVDGNLFFSPVTNFAALAGTGYVSVATLNAGSQLYPGRSNVVGTLSISNLTTLGGSEMIFDLSSSDPSSTDGANDLLQLTNATFGSQTLVGLNFYNSYPVTPNSYTVATYSGSASGLANLALDPSLVGTRAAIGLDAIDYPGQIVVIVTNGTAPITATWYGDNPNKNWDLSTTANWDSGSDIFYNADSVVFDDSAQTNVVNLVGSLYPATVTFNNDASVPYTLTGSGQIGGAVALNLSSGAVVTIDNNNGFTGGIILNGGNTLQIGTNDTAGTIGSGAVQFLNSASTLNYNRTDALTLNNRIYGSSGAVPDIEVNSGKLTLAGTADNAYATATVNSGATLVLGKTSSASVHAVGGSPYSLTVNAGGTAQLAGTGGDQIVNGGNVQSDGILDLNGQTETINNLTGVNGTGIVTNSAAGAAVLGVGSAGANVVDNGVFVKGTGGTLGLSVMGGTLTLTNANTATGPLTIVGGGFVYLSNVMAQAWSGPVTFTNVGVAPRLQFLASQQLAPTSVISFSGTSERRVELNGFTNTIGGLNDLPGVTGNVITEAAPDNTPSLPGTLIINVASGTTNSTGGFVRDAAGTSPGSMLSLIKTGAGTQIFSGVPGQVNYSGPTIISNGVLVVSGANSVLGNSAITLAGGTMDFAGGGTLGANLSGTGTLQVGGGTLIVTNTPNFIGNTWISAGTLQLGNSTFIGSLASPVITNNGTIYITNSTTSTISLTNNLTGSGTLTTLMSANGGQLVLSGNNSGWTGPITMLGNDAQTGGSGGWLVVANNSALGSPASRTITLPAANPAGAMGIELMGNVSVGTNQTIAIGGRQISAAIYGTNACLQNVSGNNNWAGTLNINGAGGLYALNCLAGQLELSGGIVNTVASSIRGFQLFGAGNYLLDGAITNGSSTALTQIQFSGTGVSVVSGTNNNYSGTTAISSGTVLVTGLIPTNTVTVATNATLGGNGLILGATTIQGGGTLTPGTASIGTLTISNTLTLSANSTNLFRLNAAATNNDAVAGLSTVTYGGALIVTNINGTLAAGQSFKLFNATTINPATFASVQLPTLTGSLAWTNTLNANGSIAVISTATVATNSVPIIFNLTGNTLNLSWPPDHLGWQLQSQTNALSTGLSNNWVTVAGSTAVTNEAIVIDTLKGSVFFRLFWP